MRVLIACEFSGIVREAFRKRGHDAWSCDVLPAEDLSPYHIQDDVLCHLYYAVNWDLMIAHPPCTHLAVSGARYFAQKISDGRQQQGIDFFMKLINAPINRIAVENPICIMSSKYRKPDQIIQPWEYGHECTKATCLWLKNLPKLIPTNIVNKGEFVTYSNGKRSTLWHSKTGGGQVNYVQLLFEGLPMQWLNNGEYNEKRARRFA